MQQPHDPTSFSASFLQEPFVFDVPQPIAVWLESADTCTTWPLSPLPEPAVLSAHECFLSLPSSAADSPGCVSTGLSSPPSLASSSRPPSPFSTETCSVPSTAPAEAAAAERHRAPTVLRHRHVEAQRRRRETVALCRLEELCRAERDEGGEQPSTVAAPASASTGRQQRQKRKNHKLSVLEASAARIERLERLLSMSELSNRKSEARVQQLSDEVDGITTRERQSLQWLQSSRSLRGTALLDTRFARTLMECPTGRLLDANSTYFSLTGFTPGGVLQRVLDPVLATAEHSATPLSDIPLVREKRCSATDSLGLRRQPMPWIPLRPLHQYPSTIRSMHELFSGVLDHCRATFRCRWVDGYAYEINAHVWLVDHEWVEEDDGSRWRRPVRFATMTSVDDCCRVDEE